MDFFAYTAWDGDTEARRKIVTVLLQSEVTDDHIEGLEHRIYSVDLSNCPKVTPKRGLRHVARSAYSVTLRDVKNISIKHIEALAGISKLDFSGCKGLRDCMLEPLKGYMMDEIVLDGCKKLTGRVFEFIGKTKRIGLHGCTGVRLSPQHDMSFLKHLDLRDCPQIDDSDLSLLPSGLEILWVSGNNKITSVESLVEKCGKSLKHVWFAGCPGIDNIATFKLRRVPKITLERCKNITNATLSNLSFGACKHVELISLDNITNKGLKWIYDIDKLKIQNCKKIDMDGVANIPSTITIIDYKGSQASRKRNKRDHDPSESIQKKKK